MNKTHPCDYYERVLEERDKQYDQRFRAAEIAVSAALSAQEKAVGAAFLASEKAIIKAEEAQAAAFLASEKAIIKAEEAQKDYNLRSNELKTHLDDQAKTLMPRPETLTLFKALEDKIVTIQTTYDNRLEGVRTNFEKSHDETIKALSALQLIMSNLLSIEAYETRHAELQQQVNDLRESRSENSGKSLGVNAIGGYLIGVAGIVFALIFHFIR